MYSFAWDELAVHTARHEVKSALESLKLKEVIEQADIDEAIANVKAMFDDYDGLEFLDRPRIVTVRHRGRACEIQAASLFEEVRLNVLAAVKTWAVKKRGATGEKEHGTLDPLFCEDALAADPPGPYPRISSTVTSSWNSCRKTATKLVAETLRNDAATIVSKMTKNRDSEGPRQLHHHRGVFL